MRTTVLLVVAGVAIVLVVVWPSRAVGGLHVSLREATDVEADEHTDLTGEGFVLLVAEIGNTSRQTIRNVRVAVPDHLPVDAAVADAPNRDVTHVTVSSLLWPVQQLATSQVGWDVGRLEPGEQATVYLAVEAAAMREAAVRAAASGVAPVTANLDGATLVTIPLDTGLHAGVDREQTEDAPSDPPHLDNDDQPATLELDWELVRREVFSGDDEQRMHAVTVDESGLVVVGEDWSLVDSTAAIWISTDGHDWQRIANDRGAFDGGQMHSVTIGGPGLVAVGHDRRRIAAAVWTSTDGIDWQRVDHDEDAFGDAYWMRAVTAGGPGLVAVGNTAAVWTSTDGLAWQRVDHDAATFSDGTPHMTSITAGGPGLVAVGYVMHGAFARSAAVWTSTDGLDWQRVEHDESVFGGEGVQRMNSVISAGPGLVAVGYDEDRGAAVWTSTDGNSWRRVEHDEPLAGGSLSSVTATEDGIVAVGGEGGDRDRVAVVLTSTDGLNWQRTPHDDGVFGVEEGGSMKSVVARESGFVAVGNAGPPGMRVFGIDVGDQGAGLVWMAD